MFLDILWVITAYLFGSIPFGLLFAKNFCKLDPRSLGSGNVGATNIARICSKKLGLVTLICDLLKGFISMVIAMHISESVTMYTITGVSVIMGHLFSCFLNFKGGKAVATYIGIFIPLAFWQLLFAIMICLFFIWRTGFVSVGSLTLIIFVPIFLLFTGRFDIIPLSIVVMCLIFWKHKENIQRLLKGEEKVWK